ncbi:MAG: hypothetical protein ACPLXC_02405 [Candidatus Pacearchaeota archaeon]
MDEVLRRFVIFISIILILLIVLIGFTLLMTGTLQFPMAKNKLPTLLTSPSITGKDVLGHVSINILPRCTFDMSNGWNFFSLCSDPDNKTIDAIVGNTTYRYVLRWNTSRMEWDIYSPRAPSNPFDSFTVNESYFTLFYSTEQMAIAGTPNPSMNITMIQGWDAPSWPYEFDTNVTKYLNETIHRYMMKWDNSSQEFLIYSPRSVENPFTKIFKGEGQMIYAYNNHTLEYNKTYLIDP